ncbi:MAG: hypothetical protein MR913_11430 [Clostridiales bacterium]|nr:hypothetical protein [Clostridiales bacterium]
MKNTMKKLLCMTLVIMLLISAVPAFAMADDFGDDMSSVTSDDFGEDAVTVQNDGAVVVADPAENDSSVVYADDDETSDTVKVTAYLYTGKIVDGAITQAKSVKSLSNKNLKSSVTLGQLLLNSEFFGQGTRDGNGIAEYQKYDYYMASGETKPEPTSVSTDDVVAMENTVSDEIMVFVRVRKTATVTLSLEDSLYGDKEITVNTFDVLDLPKTFANNGLKANSGSYIYMYTRNDEESPLGTTYRVSGNVTIVGHQDLLINKSENDKNGVGTDDSTTSGSGSSTGSGSTGSGSTGSNKFPYPVYLNIYKDTLVGSPDKRVEITKGIALDGVVTLSEVKNVVKNYYTAKDSDGISYDGLYIAEGNWVANYVADTGKYDSIDAGSMSQTGTVYINVMIGNAKVKSTATADASNPKTGDEIFVPIMVMGLTASALAAAYVIGKKRFAR